MNRIKLLREEKGMTQQELADKIDGAKSTVAMYEKEDRKPSLEVLIKLSEIFDCSIDFILGKSNIRKPENINFANNNGLNIDGLNDEQVEELKKQVEYFRWKIAQENGNKKTDEN